MGESVEWDGGRVDGKSKAWDDPWTSPMREKYTAPIASHSEEGRCSDPG